MAPRKGNTISLYLQCINSVNQILLIRGKQISIALGSLSRSLFAPLIYSLGLSPPTGLVCGVMVGIGHFITV